jgi:hypothetical protein
LRLPIRDGNNQPKGQAPDCVEAYHERWAQLSDFFTDGRIEVD